MVTRWYPSKVDWWLALILALTPLVTIFGAVVALRAGSGVIVAVSGVGLIGLLYVGLVFPMRYGMDDEHLIVRHGLIRQRIRLSEILEVFPTRSPLSSPALSLDRIEIKFGQGFFKSVMLSPTSRSEFLDELATRTGMRREGERLAR